MSDDRQRLDEHEEALNMLALLCGSLVRRLTQQGHMASQDIEDLMRSLEASAEKKSPLLTGLMEQVRWAAALERHPDAPRSIGPEDEARGGHEARGGPGPAVGEERRRP